jgi:hypothetical protein
MFRIVIATALLAAAAPAIGAEIKPGKAAPTPKTDCSVHGAGFVAIDGTGACMKISGRVRAEMMVATPSKGAVPGALPPRPPNALQPGIN